MVCGRSIRRILVLGAASAVSTLALGPVPQAGAGGPFVVTKTADTADGACNADCSLREAVIAANTSPGPDTITVPAGNYVLLITGADEDASANGDLDLTEDVTMTGAGPAVTIINANGAVTGQRALQVESGTATVSGFTFTGGNELGNFFPNAGGGIFVNDPATQLTLRNSVVTGNHSEYFSGGLDAEQPVVLENVTFSNNSADEPGGAIEIEGPSSMTNVTFSGNSSDDEGGALVVHDLLTLNNVTIVGNRANADATGDEDGGGISAHDDITMRNTVVAGNSVGGAGLGPDCHGGADIVSQGHNLIGDETDCDFTAAPTDQVGTGGAPIDPGLGPLNDNGGPVTTHALLAGSPAIDKGDPGLPGSGGTACAATDARGIPRPHGAGCDIGAYELAFCSGAVVNRVGTEGKDVLTGTGSADGFLAGSGNDQIKGLGGKDTACLGAGNDRASGGGGADFLLGEFGKDRLAGQGGSDRLLGQSGKDTILCGPGRKDVGKGGPGKDATRKCEKGHA